MESLKILTFLRYPPWDKRAGGGQVVAWSTIKGLAKEGHCLKVVIGDTPEPLPHMDNIEFFETKLYKINRTNFTWFLDSLKFKNIDLVHGFDPENFLTNWYWKKVKRAPIVHEVHSPRISALHIKNIYKISSIEAFKWHLYFSFDSLASKYSDIIMSPSNYMKNIINLEYKIPQHKLISVPNGVDMNIVNINKKNSFSNKDKNISLLFIGKLVPQKGVDVLLDSFKNIVDEFNNVILTIIGLGPQKNDYMAMSSALCLKNNVKFLGHVPNDGKTNYLINSDILIVPSRHENFPLTVLEGMGVGLPVIGTQVGGIPEQIIHNETGILIPPEDSKALANAIKCLLNNPDKAEKMGKAGKKRVKKYFTWDKVINTKIEIYKKILNN